MSSNELASELKTAIDIVSHELSPTRIPVEFSNAYRDLVTLLLIPGNWDRIFKIDEGNKFNKIQVILGKTRLEWLVKFYTDEINQTN